MVSAIVRAVVSLMVAAAAAAGLYCFAWVPWRCNLIEKAVTGETEISIERSRFDFGSTFVPPAQALSNEEFDARARARDTLERLAPCLTWCAETPNVWMLAAANWRISGQPEAAADAYEAALRLDRRPEIYLNLGVTELALGRSEKGIRDLVLAGRSGAYYNYVNDPVIRAEIMRRLREQPHDDFVR